MSRKRKETNETTTRAHDNKPKTTKTFLIPRNSKKSKLEEVAEEEEEEEVEVPVIIQDVGKGSSNSKANNKVTNTNNNRNNVNINNNGINEKEMKNVEENNHNIIGNTSDQVVNQEINDQENNYHQEVDIQEFNNRESNYQDIFTRPINFEEILKAYDFIGNLISQTEENNNCIELKFRTFYQAKFMENYYISLDKVKINKVITFTIRNHTLPDFVPLIELKLRYLDKDLNKFVDTVDDFLQAYVIKREEVKRLQAQSFINLKADTSYSLIEIYVSLEESTVEIKLKYRDLRSPFPTDASLYQICPNPKKLEPHRQRLKKREKEFKNKGLLGAFKKIFLINNYDDIIDSDDNENENWVVEEDLRK